MSDDDDDDEDRTTSTTTTTTSSSSSVACYWQLVPEEEVLYGQKALVQMLVEGDGDDDDDDMEGKHDNEKSLVEKLDILTDKVSERLLPILLEHESEQAQQQQADDPSSSSSWSSSRTERSKAIARKTILLAETKTQKGKIRHPNHCRLGGGAESSGGGESSTLLRSNIRIDPNIIAFYVLRDLFMEQPSYNVSEMLTKWSTRLPFGEKYDRIVPDDSSTTATATTATMNTVTTEWLKDRKIIPNQLTISNRKIDKDNAVKTTTTSKEATTVTVIQLTLPGSVLTL
mmetsp:Transcript_39327/g.95121  ORF Transcript_39327/g.95121 Transcript_39327/m.95121 type:complete len:286 (-) Transcript_39327:123-980(-)